MKKFLLLLFLVSTGCVVLPKKENIVDFKINNASAYNCEHIGISYGLKDIIKSSITLENYVDTKAPWRGSMNPSFFIENSLKRKSFFHLGPSGEFPQKYYLEFKREVIDYKNIFERSTLIVSLLSLGIIPGWGRGTYKLSMNVYASDGVFIKNYESSQINYTFLHGLIFLPFNCHDNTRAKINEDYLSLLTDEIIIKMINDGLIQCK